MALVGMLLAMMVAMTISMLERLQSTYWNIALNVV